MKALMVTITRATISHPRRKLNRTPKNESVEFYAPYLIARCLRPFHSFDVASAHGAPQQLRIYRLAHFGACGVDIFFAISGFILSTAPIRKVRSGRTPALNQSGSIIAAFKACVAPQSCLYPPLQTAGDMVGLLDSLNISSAVIVGPTDRASRMFCDLGIIWMFLVTGYFSAEAGSSSRLV
jgi:hypothetical protein